MTLLAKNKQGWFDLIDLVSKKNSYSDDVVHKLLKSHSENLICIDDLKQQPSYYADTKDAELHRILLCSGMKTTMGKVKDRLSQDAFKKLKGFFVSDDYYMISPEEASNKYSQDVIKNYPVARKITTDTFFLGTSPVIERSQLDYIEAVADNFFRQYAS